jgi:hypothetical protein
MRKPLHRGATTGIAGAALLALGFLVMAPHIRNGGFYSDDWGNAAGYHFDGWWRTSVSEWRHAIPGRPVLALLHPLPYALLGLDPSFHLGAAVVLAALTSLSFFAFLRAFGLELPHAFAMAALSLVFPWSDATRLWPTGAMNNVAVIAYFLGVIAALRGLTLWRTDRRRALALHVLSAVLYLVSVLTYEVAPAAILLSGLLYRTRVGWRTLRVRWLVDAILVLVPLTVSLHATSRVRHVGSPGDRIADIPHFVGQGLTIFASVFAPSSLSSSWAASWQPTSASGGKLAVLAAALSVVLVAVALRRRRPEPDLQLWLCWFAAGACAVAVAYVMFLGSGLVPLFYPGVDDRTNTLAAFGFVVATYSLVALAANLVGAGRPRVVASLLAAGAVAIGIGFIERVRVDIGRYDAATVEQRHVLERLKLALPRPARDATIFTFGYRAEVAPGVPIFKYTWDLRGAIDLRWNDRSLKGVPIYGRSVSCGRTGVSTLEFGADSAAPYGSAVFADIATGTTRLIRSRAACASARSVFRPGPVVAPGGPAY